MPVFRLGRNGYWFGVLILLQRCCLNHHSNGKTSAQTDTYNIWHALCMLKLNSSNSNSIQLNGYGYGSLLDYLVKHILQLRIRHIGRLQNVGASSGKIHKFWAGHKILRLLMPNIGIKSIIFSTFQFSHSCFVKNIKLSQKRTA